MIREVSHICWTCILCSLQLPYDVYDPKTYTLAKNNFPDHELSCVDEDILE